MTNNGNFTLIDIEVNDDIEGDILNCDKLGIVPGQYTNTVTVTGFTTNDGSKVSAQDQSHYYGKSLSGHFNITINIKGGRKSNEPAPINLKSKGKVLVAVLSDGDFDASTIDPLSVLFAGAEASHWNVGNVGANGNMKALFHFPTHDLILNQNNTSATLTGQTLGGQTFMGTDSVRIVPLNPNKPPKTPKNSNPNKPTKRTQKIAR